MKTKETIERGAWSAVARRRKAVDALRTAAAAIGPIEHGLAVFLVTRGQFSLFDMIRHCADEIGPAAVSIWTWAMADFEVEALGGLLVDRTITGGRLVLDRSAEQRNSETAQAWRDRFGADAIRICKNHAKMARVWNEEFRVLIRGSMNLNFNPRFEQADITEGGEDFELVARIEDELPVLRPMASNAEAEAASGVSLAFERATLEMFSGVKAWGAKVKPWAK